MRFDVAAAIDITLNGPPAYCYQTALGLRDLCSSSTVLVAIAWASSSLSQYSTRNCDFMSDILMFSACVVLLYFLTIFITSVSHYSEYRGVWWITVYNMPWFDIHTGDSHPPSPRITFPEPDIPRPPPPKSPYENPCFSQHEESPIAPPVAPWVSDAYRNTLSSSNYSSYPGTGSEHPTMRSEASRRPAWAKTVNTRRGVDPPFSPFPNTTQRISGAIKSLWPGGAPPPTPPPKMEFPVPLHREHGSFVDCHRSSYGRFPQDVGDVDLPIARTHMKEWVTAERAVLAH